MNHAADVTSSTKFSRVRRTELRAEVRETPRIAWMVSVLCNLIGRQMKESRSVHLSRVISTGFIWTENRVLTLWCIVCIHAYERGICSVLPGILSLPSFKILIAIRKTIMRHPYSWTSSVELVTLHFIVPSTSRIESLVLAWFVKAFPVDVIHPFVIVI